MNQIFSYRYILTQKLLMCVYWLEWFWAKLCISSGFSRGFLPGRLLADWVTSWWVRMDAEGVWWQANFSEPNKLIGFSCWLYAEKPCDSDTSVSREDEMPAVFLGVFPDIQHLATLDFQAESTLLLSFRQNSRQSQNQLSAQPGNTLIPLNFSRWST